MTLHRKPISVSEALKRIESRMTPGISERVPITEAVGRYLAEDIIADHAVPPFDRSMMDGYAVRSEDTLAASEQHPVTLKVTGQLPAGTTTESHLQLGEAMRIMTGAALPPGADAVIPIEKVQVDKSGEIIVKNPVRKGQDVAHKGEYTALGERVVAKGSRIHSGMIAALASFGYHQVSVSSTVKVGYLAMGSELLPVEAPLRPGQIRDSNSSMLHSLILEMGGEPICYGRLPDDAEQCLHTVRKALDEVDILLTTGGASVGDYDWVPYIMEQMEAEVLFNKVSMRPGSVTTVGVKGDKWIFGLSGNPASCFLGFQWFARPVILGKLLASDVSLFHTEAILSQDISGSNAFTRYMRAKVNFQGAQLHVRPMGVDKPGVVSTLAQADVLLEVPPGDPPKKGEKLSVYWLRK